MIQIPLTKGYTAIVDDEDAHLAELRWHANVGPFGMAYAKRDYVPSRGKRGAQFLHREVLGLKRGDGTIVDHINGDGLDCRRSNLRVVTKAENCRNLGGGNRGSTSRFLGVDLHKTGWRARITVDGKTTNLGSFPTQDEANVARLKAEKALFGIRLRRQAAFEEAGLS